MATGSYQYLMKIIKQNTLRSSKITDQLRVIPCSNDCICTTLLIQIFLKTTTQQHHVTYVFCPFPSRPILQQCSLTIVDNQILQWAHRDHNLFFKGVITIWILTRLANLLQKPIKVRFWHVFTICWQPSQKLLDSWHWDCCILPFDRVLDRKFEILHLMSAQRLGTARNSWRCMDGMADPVAHQCEQRRYR